MAPASGAEPWPDLEVLRQNEARLRALVDSTSQIVWASAPDGEFLLGSQSWSAFTGQAPEATREWGWLEVLHPEDRPLAAKAWERAVAEQAPYEVRFRLRRWDGVYVWMHSRGLPLRDADGRVREWVGTCTDIHARHQAEQRVAFLGRAGELLSASLDYAATLAALARLTVPELGDWCIVDVLNADGHFERAQVAAADPAQAELSEMVRGLSPGADARSRYPPTVALSTGQPSLLPDVTDEMMQAVAQDAHHLSVMRRVGFRSLLTVPLMARGRILGALTFLMTASGRRHGEDDLRFALVLAHRAALAVDNARLYHEAQEAIRLRDEFLSIASHELKTPLTPLSLKLHALGRAAEAHPDSPLAPVVRAHVEAGHRQLRKLTELMKDLLDVSCITAGTFRLQREPVDLVALVREVAAQFDSRAAQVSSPLVLRAEAPVQGHWDRSRLAQVVGNLLDNALKYGAGAPVHVDVSGDAGHARLTVHDAGIGIAPELLGRIFERYGRAVSERHYGGLGLGLYITRTIVEAEGGRVHVDSAPGRGATFVVELPLSRP